MITRETFRQERRSKKDDLLKYATCCVLFQIELERLMSDKTDKAKLVHAMKQFQNEPELAIILESVRDADAGLLGEQAKQILEMMDDFVS